MSAEPFTLAERAQLRMLKAVHDNPMITATWRKAECDSLVRLGLARRIMYGELAVVAITDAGLEVAATLDGPQRVTFDPTEIHEAEDA